VNETYLPYTLVFLATLVYFGYYDASLAVLLVVLAIIVVCCLLTTPHRCGDDAYRTDKSREDMLEQVDETLRNLPSVYGARNGEKEITKLEDLARVYSKNYSETMQCGIQARVGVSCGLVAIFVAFTVRLVQLVRYKRIGAPQFASLFMVFTTLAFNVMWILNSSRYAVFDGGVVQNIDRFLTTPVPPASATMDVSLKEDQQLLPPFPDRLGLHKVSFTYKSGTRKVLDNLSISFEPGHITSLLGGIGTGKSTIVRLLLGLQKPDTGDLYLPGGQWYSDVDVSVVRKHVGYVPQEPMLFDRTVLQNIRYGSEQHFTEQDVMGVLQDTGVADIFTSLSHGVNSKVGKNGSRLSGGQRQLVWFMRVLLQRPQALVLDEPTASMDQPTKQVLARLLRTYVAAGYIAIVVTHDDFLKHIATRSIHLNDVK
jgi:ABC-type multidrug transport system fused ATPase/permease subunit